MRTPGNAKIPCEASAIAVDFARLTAALFLFTGCASGTSASAAADAVDAAPARDDSSAAWSRDGSGAAEDASALIDSPLSNAEDANSTTPSVDATARDADAQAPLTTPVVRLTMTTGLYPRAIVTRSGDIVVAVVAPQSSGHLGGTIFRSTDDAVHFTEIGHVDEPLGAGGLCCATIFELPQALGTLAAGTLLWAAEVGGDAKTNAISIPVWKSVDEGRTWSRLSTLATAGVPRTGGLWEPEFAMLSDGTLVCHYSDETEVGHSQVLTEVRTRDGVGWGSRHDTVALAAQGARPGMATVRRGPGGQWFMSYEVCGTPAEGCAAHLRVSQDGWNWGDPTNAGMTPKTAAGHEFRHAPTMAFSPSLGRLYLVGQMVYDDAGRVAAENGTVVFAGADGGVGPWDEIGAPVPVPEAADNYCPNYSSTLLILDQGRAMFEMATRSDGTTCSPYFARGPLP